MSIGGTSGGAPGNSGNLLSINLGGVGLQYDLGPSAVTVADQAYSFLGNSFNADQNFLGGAIHGSTDFLNGIIQPVVGLAKSQQAFNVTALPSMFSTLQGENYDIASQAVAANEQVAQASIASSNASAKAAGSGGGCYITTAVCGVLGLPDDCHTLKTLREFRDSYLLRTNVGRAFVEEYYATAPALVAKIESRPDAREYLGRLYERFILPALLAIEHGARARAFKIYREMIYAVRAEVR